MSLQKTLITSYNTTATYWKIVGISIAYVPGIAVINLGGYTDEEAKMAKADCFPRNFRITGDKFLKYFNAETIKTQDIRDIGYRYIKENIEEFKDALEI